CLSLSELEVIERHVTECDACCKTLQSTPEDRMLAMLRRLAMPSSADETNEYSGANDSVRSPAGGAACDFLAPAQASGELGRLGPYRVLRVLGTGGMGVVFEAEDPQLKRVVALKALKPTLAAKASNRQRFLREAEATAALEDGRIVTIYQVSEDRGLPYFAMQLLHGETLETRLKREGRLAVAETVRIGREIAAGLAHAHMHGLLHRDIKPANVFLVSGGVVSGDW